MPLNYDERQKTRVYRREKADAAKTRPYDEHIGFTQPLVKPKGVFDGISTAQVVAGAAAAATSMLLASKIGIAGSVIGAAVSSAVTVICSQLYRRALEKSAEKLKLDQLGLGANEEQGNGAGYTPSDPYGAPAAGAGGFSRGARIAPTTLRMRAAEERRNTQRKVLVASIALAVAAVVITAGAILLSTSGQGLGERPEPLFSALSQQLPSPDHPADAETANNGGQATDIQQVPGNSEPDETGDNTSDDQPDGAGDNEGAAQPNAPDEGTGTGVKDSNESDAAPQPEAGSNGEPDEGMQGSAETDASISR